jgi:AraC-like DNA-binding protein
MPILRRDLILALKKRAPYNRPMSEGRLPFTHSLLPFVATTLASHRNPVTCLLSGLDRPLVVSAGGERVEADMVVIRPDVEHSVEIYGRAKVIYFDGLAFPFAAEVASLLPGNLAALATDALDGSVDAIWELRHRLADHDELCPPVIASIIKDIVSDPMDRMSQFELANRIGMERTRALRSFKHATGMTFRAFKNWAGVQAAARQIAEGELVRTAALDAGFSDSAHLTRSFRIAFGTTPSAATADLQH